MSVLDVTTPVLPGAKAGIYTLRCIATETHGGTFRLTDPDGFLLGDFKIPAGAGNSITVDNDIKGVIADGTTDFAVADGFDITVAAGAGKYVKAVSTAGDGFSAMTSTQPRPIARHLRTSVGNLPPAR